MRRWLKVLGSNPSQRAPFRKKDGRVQEQIFVSETGYSWVMLAIPLVEGVILPVVMVLTFQLVFRPRAAVAWAG